MATVVLVTNCDASLACVPKQVLQDKRGCILGAGCVRTSKPLEGALRNQTSAGTVSLPGPVVFDLHGGHVDAFATRLRAQLKFSLTNYNTFSIVLFYRRNSNHND